MVRVVTVVSNLDVIREYLHLFFYEIFISNEVEMKIS